MEGAIAISILVAAFAGLMAIVQEVYTGDRLGRAARAAARAIALNANADPCAAIRREFGLPEGFDCDAQWRITVRQGLRPSDLSSVIEGASVDTDGSGDMVMVRIAWNDGSEVPEDSTLDETGTDLDTSSRADLSEPEDDTPESDEPASDARTVPMVAMGVARSEPEAG